MNYPLKISINGINLIKGFEKFVPYAYQDSVGVWTIGYGSTKYKDGTKPKKTDTITEPDAEQLLTPAMKNFADATGNLIHSVLTQNQQDALLSLLYNIGVGNFAKSTVLKIINVDPNNPDIGYYWKLWNKATYQGKLKELPGLTNRRIKEYDLFRT